MRDARACQAGESGNALVFALIVLVVLTLLALATIRSARQDAKMSTRNSTRTEAFESSELPRTAVTNLIDALCYADGWPAAIGGDATMFDAAIPAGLTIAQTNGKPDFWCSMSDAGFDPANLGISASFLLNYRGDGSTAAQSDVTVGATIAVHRLYVTGAPGFGQAQAYGYSSPGISVAGGGGNVLFYVNSRGTQNDGNGNALATDNTSTIFRYVVRN